MLKKLAFLLSQKLYQTTKTCSQFFASLSFFCFFFLPSVWKTWRTLQDCSKDKAQKVSLSLHGRGWGLKGRQDGKFCTNTASCSCAGRGGNASISFFSYSRFDIQFEVRGTWENLCFCDRSNKIPSLSQGMVCKGCHINEIVSRSSGGIHSYTFHNVVIS